MNVETPTTRVADLLEANGFQRVGSPLQVGTISFNFACVLAGTMSSSELVVVEDRVEQPDEGLLRRQVDALSRALDVIGSTRPLTLVLVGPRPSDLTIRALTRTCRVLHVGTPTSTADTSALRDALAALLPLSIPTHEVLTTHPLALLKSQLDGDAEPWIDEVLAASEVGADAVVEALAVWLEAGLEAGTTS